MKRVTLLAVACVLGLGVPAAEAQQRPDDGQVRIFNTVKTKLAAGEQVVGGTVSTADPEKWPPALATHMRTEGSLNIMIQTRSPSRP